jgi:pimeloyl-ACP methyl ester carboxylesterase
LITLALGALVYWRPVATINAVQSGLLRLSGIKSQYAQVGPYRVHYLLGGEGPPLLLLHGHPSRALEWGSLLPELTRAHRVIAIDFLGYGESDAPDVDYSVATQTEVVTGLLDALQLAQADVLGFSWVAG